MTPTNSETSSLDNEIQTIKTKYNVIEPHYMEGTTPDGPVAF